MVAACVHIIYTLILVFRFKSSTTKRKLRRALWLHKPKKNKQNVQINSDKLFQKTPTCEHPTTSSIIPAKCRPKRRRRKLFEDNTHGTYLNNEYERCNTILPDVIEKLYGANQLGDFANILKLISVDKWPLDNIAWLLLLDVSRWLTVHQESHNAGKRVLFVQESVF